MKILIDTHVFLWVFGGRKLSKTTRQFFENTEEHEFQFSHVTAWEIAIKFGLKKLRLPEAPEVFIPDRVRRAGFSHLAIELQHVLQVHSLPMIHKDPFDRLLISQAKIEELTILTDDPIIRRYDGVKVLDFADIS